MLAIDSLSGALRRRKATPAEIARKADPRGLDDGDAERRARDLVVIEPTGGYERGAVGTLQDQCIAVARVNPMQARTFAKSWHAS